MMGECLAGSLILRGIRVVRLRHGVLDNSASNYFPRGAGTVRAGKWLLTPFNSL